ncbi:MAG: hypothetical protein ACRDHN_05545, partial [Thermomicrobiales bacterium]
IHDRVCHVGFSNYGNEWQECLQNVGLYTVMYRVAGPTEASDLLTHGNVTFSWLEPGSYSIGNDLGYQVLDGSVYCSTMNAIGVPFLSQQANAGDHIEMIIEPGDDVICDWYHYPTAEFYQGGIESPVGVTACDTPTDFHPGSGETYPQCHRVDGVDLTVYPSLEPQFAQTCTTGDGTACRFSLPNQILLTVTVDESDLPVGWVAQCNPCEWRQYGEWTGFVVQLNPIDASSKGD